MTKDKVERLEQMMKTAGVEQIPPHISDYWKDLVKLWDLYTEEEVQLIVYSMVEDEGSMNFRMSWVKFPDLGKSALKVGKPRVNKAVYYEAQKTFNMLSQKPRKGRKSHKSLFD